MDLPDPQRSTQADAQPNISFLVRVLIESALGLHAAAGAACWLLSPKGFPVRDSRFWIGTVIPLVVVLAACFGLAGMFGKRRRWTAVVVLGFASAWAAAAITARLAFPVSLAGLWIAGIGVAALGAGLYWLLIRGERQTARVAVPLSTLAGLMGAFVVWAERPPEPSTNPLNQRPAPPPLAQGQDSPVSCVEFGDGSQFYPATADLVVYSGGVRLGCSPLLTFDRISPDGFWSILAPELSPGEWRRFERQTLHSGVHTFSYSDGSIILLPDSERADEVEMTAYSSIDRKAYSHLNSFCTLEINRHAELRLAFSPCPNAMIDVLPADYPRGRPARFGYLDASGLFCVVEATSGEKGPFHRLASGPLRRGDPLSITLYDRSRPVATVTLQDWSRQASTALSPTAGWGIPINAIEFQRLGNAPGTTAMIWITLAATSVGRGWDTVGHSPGVYRNRIVVQTVPHEVR